VCGGAWQARDGARPAVGRWRRRSGAVSAAVVVGRMEFATFRRPRMSDVWGVLIAPVNGCPRHREVSAAHSQRHCELVAGLVLGFAARRRRPEVRSEKMFK
jgi:hypothetical protein